jgi:serine/threonine protein kinase
MTVAMATDQARVEELFDAARSRPVDERARYLAEACGPDTELRTAIESLLAAHDAAGEFLRSPAVDADLDPPPMFTAPGTMIGRYKMLELIGEGGYGAVFMAEQTSPVQRRVALKIIKAGMDTRQVIARFEAERQALALMDHPNIAKVHDAGVTETGRPYFVMELVKGVAITKYCDEHKLVPKQRLELFIQVCQAVQHAHQKGIIHRDIKPSNVLVALYDGKPVPKVIDFGVAKATGQKLTERTMFTGFGDVIGTLEYMSPEQAEMNQLDVDTRSDIYSLGVLLYELLTGSTPLENKRIKKVALLEVLRFIREEEPPKPSTRLSTAEQLPTIAASRGVEPKKLSTLVHGELDWIVMKALEKDRSRRYETANGFAMDVQRYLADEPVHACPPSATYRFRKFARRNRLALTAASAMLAMLLLLVGALAVSNVLIARERNDKAAALADAQEQRRRAEESAQHATAERQRAETASYKARLAVNEVVINAALGIGKWSGMPIEQRKIVVADAVKYYESLIQTNNAEPAARYETAIALGNIGLMHWAFAEYEQAEKHYRRACDVLDALVRDVPKPAEYRQQCAYRHYELANTLRRLDRTAEGEEQVRIAIPIYETLCAETPGRLNISSELARCYSTLIEAVAPAPEAQALYRKLAVCAEAACKPLLAGATTRPADQARREAEALYVIGACLVLAHPSVGRDHQLVIRICRAGLALDPGNAKCLITLAEGHYLAGDYDAAKAAFEKADELKARYQTDDLLFVAMTLWRTGNQPRAMRNYEAADKRRGSRRVGSVQREAAELMGITIPPATQPTSQPTSHSSG